MDAALSTCIDQVRAAAAARRALEIRGGGSKAFYGEPPRGERLDTGGLAGIRSYEPSELVVTVGAGTPLAQLEAVLAERGQVLPFEPPHLGPATVGGMVATGLSGPARANAGSVRDHVLGLSLVDGHGELLSFGGQVMKNVAGYDVSRLMAGALGTLGLLVEVSLKVLPRAPAEATLRFALPQDEALRRLQAWGGQPLPLNASCWEHGADGPVLWLRLRGAQAAVESACRALGGERLPADGGVWHGCREQALPFFQAAAGRDLWRLSVPPATPALDLPQPTLVEWHGGQRWVVADAADGSRVRAAALAAGGHATLFRAGGGSPLARMQPLPAVLARIHRELKKRFDPAGIFNPGRLLPDL